MAFRVQEQGGDSSGFHVTLDVDFRGEWPIVTKF
jgi:hypothetical protein